MPSSSQPGSRMTTGRPSSIANPISASVPQLPPTAITASPDAATARFRACPMPGDDAWSIHSFASAPALAGENADRRASRLLRPPSRRGHHLAEAAGDDRAAALGEQAPDLLGPSLVLGAAADHRNLDTMARW